MKLYINLGNWAKLGIAQFWGVTPGFSRTYKLGTIFRGEKGRKKGNRT
jgi:hypothetical protein